MGELAPIAFTGGAVSAGLGFLAYFLRYVSGLHDELRQSRSANAQANLERAMSAEASVAALQERITKMQIDLSAAETDVMDERARWNRRTSAVQVLRRVRPDEYKAWKTFEALVDETLRGEPDVS